MNDDPPWVSNPPTNIDEIAILLENHASYIREDSAKGKVLRHLFKELRGYFDSALLMAHRQYPIAFFKPSYEQALMLNAWIWGINFPICFASNRIGKTVCFTINAILWIFPNNPSWRMFKPYIDHLGRLVAVIPRPKLSSLLGLQTFLFKNPHLNGDLQKQPYEQPNLPKFKALQQEFANLQLYPCYPDPPVTKSGTIWLGAPDLDWQRNIFMKRWKDWLPSSSIDKWNVTECYFNLRIKWNDGTREQETAFLIDCKSYDSEHTKWSGDAVQGIVLTEGFTKDILNEIKQRIINDGFMSWDYTPAEARNTGKKVKLAYDVFKGHEPLPLRQHIFLKFSVRNAPEHIIPKEKKEDLIRMWDGKPEGKARIDGDFYASSGAVLDKLDRNFHCLDWTLDELFSRVPDGRFYRGIDPGLDHPTACAWGYLSRNNIWFIYRFYSERGKTIPQRCSDIITLSNNTREKFQLKGGRVFWREIHNKPNSEVFTKSMIDYHIFKEDEETGLSYAQKYIEQGLVISESTHMKPEMRGQHINTLLDPKAYPYYAHPRSGLPPGAKIFFLTKQPGVAKALDKLEEVFWDRYKSGENVGEPKDQVQIHGDDELDALSYLGCDTVCWTPYQPKPRQMEESEPESLLQATY